MDEKSSFQALATVAAAIVFIILGVGLLRRKRSYVIYSIGAIIATGGLLSLARASPSAAPALMFVALVSIWLYALFMTWGLCVQIGIKPALRLRFIAWILCCALILAIVGPMPIFQMSLAILGVLVFTLECAAAIQHGRDKLPIEIRGKILIVSFFVFIVPLLQIAYIGLAANGIGRPVSAESLFPLAFNYLVFQMVVSCNLAIGLDLAMTHEDLRLKTAILAELATTDNLTGLCNRKLFDSRVVEEANKANRYGEEVSLIILDLDRFKVVNDKFGHQAGDEVLRRTANIAQKAIRSTDALFRWGGEEFAILTPGTGRCGAMNLAEKIRSSIADAEYPVPQQVTASFGVAEFLPEQDISSWFKNADDALYRAKVNGRNRVELFS